MPLEHNRQVPRLNIVTIANNANDLSETVSSVKAFSDSYLLETNYVIVLSHEDLLSPDSLEIYPTETRSIHTICQSSTGISNAFNSAFPYLVDAHTLYLNAGDVIHKPTDKQLYKPLIEALRNHPSALIILDTCLLPSTTMPRQYVKLAYRLLRLPFLVSRIPHQSTFIPISSFTGQYDESLRCRMDYKYFYSNFKMHKHQCILIPIRFADMKPGGISSHLSKSYFEEALIHSQLDSYKVIHSIRITITALFKRMLLLFSKLLSATLKNATSSKKKSYSL